jgi:peptidoglycan hydrolase-like protein with peptidoglycan-binding domain
VFKMMYSIVFLLGCIHAQGQLDLSDMPRSLCGWPSLHTTGKFPEWNTRIAQYLLGFALNASTIVADGIFTSQTTADIESFQAQEGLVVNGYLNIDTWPSLIALASPLTYPSSSGIPITAVQDALCANGYNVPVSGIYDSTTADALSKFQNDRGASVVSGEVVDDQTWHLLTTQCNISQPGHYWFDAGWPQGAMSLSTMQCLHDTGFEYTTIECWREKDNGSFVDDCVGNIANAWAAGFVAVDVYMYPYRFTDPSEQAKSLLSELSSREVKYGAVMIDVEGDNWNSFTTTANQEFMLALREVFDEAGVSLLMYAGDAWNSYFGENFTAFSDVPLVYAHYDNIPSFYDYDFAPYGGWTKAAAKQFWDGVDDEIVCGIALDWDWSPVPFWEDRT